MALAATEIDRNGDISELDFKSSPLNSMDGSQEYHSQDLYSCDVDTSALTMETSTRESSTASLHDYINDENDLEDPIKIEENSIPSIIEEICPVEGPCVQCEIEQPCSFRFTNNGETLYVCNEPCIKAYQAEYPGKYTVTRKKYIIEEITPKTLLCSECEQNKTCYFYHNFDGEETYYCSPNCLEVMMADEKDKYAFKLKSGTICIDQITSKEGQCLICEKVKLCEFSLVRYGEPRLLCERACIKILSRRECGRYYIKKLRVSKPAVSNAIDKNLDEAKASAMVQREQSFLRRCSQCTVILLIDGNVLTWEAMDFCDEICLERFQNGIGSRCAKCNTLVQHTSLGKYCVRFGYDIRQFCNSSCLDEFKKGLKICCYCLRDISATAQVFLAPEGDKGHYKKFCSQSCVEIFDQMSKNPVPQPVRAKCAVCSLEKATTIEVEVTETASKRICSDPCFAAYKFANNILPDQCKWCKKYFERNPTKSFTTYDGSNPNCFCSLSCMTIHIYHTKFTVSCDQCNSKKYNFDMIRRMDDDQAVMMCSLHCLSLFQESENAMSSSNGLPPPTLVLPVPSVEQVRADVMASAAEQLVKLTKSRKRRVTTQPSKQEQHQRNESSKKVRFANPKSPRSGRKKKTRSSRVPETPILDGEPEPQPSTNQVAEPLDIGEMDVVWTENIAALSQPIITPQSGKIPTKLTTSTVTPFMLCESSFTQNEVESKNIISVIPEDNPSEASKTVSTFNNEVYGVFQKPGDEVEVDEDANEDVVGNTGNRRTALDNPGSDIEVDEDVNEDVVGNTRNRRTALDNPGSDVEVDEDASEDDFINTGNRRTALESSTDLPDNVNPLYASRLLEIERQDDMFLRGTLDSDKLTFDWNQDQNTFKGVKEVYTATAGPTFSVDHLSPLDILEKNWDDQIMTRIVEQTNIYARQIYRKNSLENSRIKAWKDINTADLWVFFAILILQSLDPRPVESEYWYSSIPELDMPTFRKVMPYKKFLLIKRCLHFVDNDSISNPNKLTKIQPIIDHLNLKFAELFVPGQDIALDESLLLWKGNLGFVQRIATKAASVGVKTYELCDSKTGYLWGFRVYTGKQNSDTGSEAASNSAADVNEPDGKVSAIVFDLMRPLLNKGHVLIMDNFYNSPLLSRLLKNQNTDTIGTLRLNREFVPDSLKNLPKKDLRVGEVACSHTYDLSVVLWRDANLVGLISTYHKIEIGGKEKYGTYKYKPDIVLDYNNSMGGVDKKDQLLTAFPIERGRNHIWYKKVFRRLFNVSLCNSWIMYKHKHSQLSHRRFREMIVRNIILKYQAAPGQVINKRPHNVRPQLVGGHYLVKGPSARARCKWCADKGRDSRTSRRCDVCKVPLCVEPCFKNYHTVR